MRIRSILPVPAAAVLLLVALAGCASGASSGDAAATSASPGSSASAPASSTGVSGSAPAVDLAGTTWRVAGAAGVTDGTTVHFEGTAVTVAASGRSSSFAWSAQGDQVLIGGGTSSLAGAAPAAWLTRTVRVQRTADGWTLLGPDGAATARLTAASTASPEPTTATTLLRTGTPGPGVVDTAASALEGRWVVASSPTTAITFVDGAWHATSSCVTGALGGRGRYRVLDGGRLLVVRTASAIRGCPVVDGVPRIGGNAITGITRAASFRVQGDTLRLFDRNGDGIGALVRG